VPLCRMALAVSRECHEELVIFPLDNPLEIGKMSFIPAKKLFSKNN
jgi:hypothetical protein